MRSYCFDFAGLGLLSFHGRIVRDGEAADAQVIGQMTHYIPYKVEVHHRGKRQKPVEELKLTYPYVTV